MNEIAIARQRAGVARTMVWLSLAVEAMFTASEAYSIYVLDGIGSGFGDDAAVERIDLLGAITGLASVIGLILAVVFVARWIMAANRAAQAMSGALTITPGWAVGWYFIPIANLFKPFEGMTEIWRSSVFPDDPDEVAIPALLRWWWGLWLVSNVVANISFRLSLRAETNDQIVAVNWINVVSFVIDIALTLVFVRVIAGVTQWQREASATVQSEAESPPID